MAVSHNGFAMLPPCAKAVGLSSASLRSLCEDEIVLGRKLPGAQRGRWQVNVRSLAQYVASEAR